MLTIRFEGFGIVYLSLHGMPFRRNMEPSNLEQSKFRLQDVISDPDEMVADEFSLRGFWDSLRGFFEALVLATSSKTLSASLRNTR